MLSAPRAVMSVAVRHADLRRISHRKKGPPISAVSMPDGHSPRVRHDGARREVACDEERRAEQRGGGQCTTVVGADEQPHHMRHDQADESDLRR